MYHHKKIKIQIISHRFSLKCQVMLSVGGDKRLIHLVVCYIVTRFDLDQQYFGEKSMERGKVVIVRY